MSLEDDDAGNIEEDVKQNRLLPQNQNNSCFMDAVLTSLFAFSNTYLDFLFFKSSKLTAQFKNQEEAAFHRHFCKLVKKFALSIRGNDITRSPTELVRTIHEEMKKCTFFTATSRQEDAGEFLTRLIQMLQLQEVNHFLTCVFGTKDLLSNQPTSFALTTNRMDFTGLVHSVTLPWKEDVTIEDLLVSREDSGILKDPLRAPGNGACYHRVITYHRFVPACAFVLYLERASTGKDGQMNKTTIQIPESCDVGGRKFFLHSLVLRKGNEIANGHFVALAVNPKSHQWFLFDDQKREEQLLGAFHDAMRWTEASSCCTILTFVC